MAHSEKSRRRFLKKALGTALATSASAPLFANSKSIVALPRQIDEKKYTPNDQVNIAVIGTGIMGFNNLRTSQMVFHVGGQGVS